MLGVSSDLFITVILVPLFHHDQKSSTVLNNRTETAIVENEPWNSHLRELGHQ